MLRLLKTASSGWQWIARWSGYVTVALILSVSFLGCVQPRLHGVIAGNLLSIAAGFLHGVPMYHGLRAPAMYTLIYGPYAALVYTPVLWVAPHPWAVRLAVAGANLAGLAALYLALRRVASHAPTMAAMAVTCGLLTATQWTEFAVNPDIWAFFLINCCLLWVTSRRLVAAIFFGAAVGVLADLKLSLVPVGCLLLLRLLRHVGWRRAAVAAVCAVVTAVIPFTSQSISLRNYAAWLSAANHRVSPSSLVLSNALCVVLFFLPVLLLRLGRRPDEAREPESSKWPLRLARLETAMLLVTAGLLWYTGSKTGGGSWHLWPLLPFLAIAFVRLAGPRAEEGIPLRGDPALSHRMATVVAALCVASLLLSLRYVPRSFAAVYARSDGETRVSSGQAERELQGLLLQYRGQRVAMAPGLGSHGAEFDLRFELVRQNGTYFVDPIAVEALSVFGTVPPLLTGRVLDCDTVWLVVHGETPFSTLNPNPGEPYLFPDSIRLGFPRTYTVGQRGGSYDVWTCGEPKSGKLTPVVK